MIVIVDSGGANLVSLSAAISRTGKKSIISSREEDIAEASHIILPGVGSAEKVMQRLNSLGLTEVLTKLTKPVLGICVGMQVLFEFSEEGATKCLGIMQGSIAKLKTKLCLPHMGWNTVKILASECLMKDIPEDAYFYYTHSFGAPLSSFTTAATDYGSLFSAAIQYRNFMGVQFHPELSGKLGAKLLSNFLEYSL